MIWWQALLWGVFGGLALDAVDFYQLSRSAAWRRNLELASRDYLLLGGGVVVRVLIGGGVAVAAVESNQVAGPVGAVAMGAGAPLILQQLAKVVAVEVASGQTRLDPSGQQTRVGAATALDLMGTGDAQAENAVDGGNP
jgi:hypothetical protein